MCPTSFLNSPEYDLSTSDFGEKLLTNHDLTQLLYKSSMSYIYILKHKNQDKIYTLKAIRKQKNIQFNLKPLMDLNHPLLPTVHHIHESKSFIYVMKDYIQGQTLKSYIDENHPLEPAKIEGILKDLFSIFKYFHNQKEPMIYRDLKPENIILNPKGHIYLVDLITLRINEKSKAYDTYYVGTKGYASPEQFGYSQSSPQTDIYTLGTTFYYMLTGQVPTIELLDPKAIDSHLEFSNTQRLILKKSTAFDPKMRFKSIEDFEAAYFNNNPSLKKSVAISFMILLMVLFLGFKTFGNPLTEKVPELNEPMTIDTQSKEDPLETLEGTKKEPTKDSIEKRDTSWSHYYQDLGIKDPKDIPIDDLVAFSKGIEIHEKNGSLTTELILDEMAYPFNQVKYLSVTSTDEEFTPFADGLIKHEIYDATFNGHGLMSIRTHNPYLSNIKNAKEALVLIYDDNYRCLGYHHIKNLNAEASEKDDEIIKEKSSDISDTNQKNTEEISSKEVSTESISDNSNRSQDSESHASIEQEDSKASQSNTPTDNEEAQEDGEIIESSSYHYYQDLGVNSPLDIPTKGIQSFHEGLILKKEMGTLVIKFDIEKMTFPFNQVKYLGVGTTTGFTRPFDELLKDSIYGATIKGYGLMAYNDDYGYRSDISGRSEALIIIYDKNYKCLGYHYIDDLSRDDISEVKNHSQPEETQLLLRPGFYIDFKDSEYTLRINPDLYDKSFTQASLVASKSPLDLETLKEKESLSSMKVPYQYNGMVFSFDDDFDYQSYYWNVILYNDNSIVDVISGSFNDE